MAIRSTRLQVLCAGCVSKRRCPTSVPGKGGRALWTPSPRLVRLFPCRDLCIRPGPRALHRRQRATPHPPATAGGGPVERVRLCQPRLPGPSPLAASPPQSASGCQSLARSGVGGGAMGNTECHRWSPAIQTAAGSCTPGAELTSAQAQMIGTESRSLHVGGGAPLEPSHDCPCG